MGPSGWMEPGRKDRSSECVPDVALGNEAGRVCSRRDDGRGRRVIAPCFWCSPGTRIFNCYESGTGSTQTKIPFWQVATAENTGQGLETKTHLPCDCGGCQSPGVLAHKRNHPDGLTALSSPRPPLLSTWQGNRGLVGRAHLHFQVFANGLV